eukprot:COSAG01_NODE_32892_length_573_cov_1.997890_1_plen_34_part_01
MLGGSGQRQWFVGYGAEQWWSASPQNRVYLRRHV